MSVSKRTLGQLSLHPARQKIDISKLASSVVGQNVKAYFAKNADNNMANPDQQAVTFYAFMQMFGIMGRRYDANEPLSEDDTVILQNYEQWLKNEAIRAAMYLLVIIIRESRHAHDSYAKDTKIGQETSPKAVEWLRKHKSGENYSSLWTDPPACTFGQLVTAIRRFFYEVPFSSNYGGKPWGGIADCMESFVFGRTSLEVMLDTNWTLSHNNGPIFNKGMLYKGYDHARLKYILDVQRGGQIMQGILEEHNVLNYATSSGMKHLVTQFAKRYPEEFKVPYIDWYAVEKLGAVNSVEMYQKQQNQKWGLSPAAKALQEAEEAKVKAFYEEQKAQAAKLAAEQAAKFEEEQKLFYHVDTTLKVKKVDKVRTKGVV